MSKQVLDDLASQFNLTPEKLASEIAFVIGDDVDPSENFDDLTTERLYSYFYSVYGSPSNMSPDDETETFTNLIIRDWRQFASIDIDLSSRLTILTGENGTGKTSLLHLIGQSFGEIVPFLGTPIRDETGFQFRQGRRRPTGEFEQIGVIRLRSGASTKVGLRQWDGSNEPFFHPELAPYRSIPGLYLDAQRVIGPYQRLESIPPRFNSAREIADAYKQQLRNIWIPHQLVKSPSLLIKEALVAAALYGEGNSMVVGDPRAAQVWNGFQEVLRRTFPASLEFLGLVVDQGELIIRTKSGDFALEAASGGIAAIVSLVWQIYLHAVDSPDAFTVCFDEPENHLHPSMQRTLLPALMQAFPNVNFIVATHSPFVVTSTRDASVVTLRRNDKGLVYSEKIDLGTHALSADSVLDEVLGVGVTMPVWAEEELGQILGEFQTGPGHKPLHELIAALEAAGLDISIPDVTEAVATSIEGSGESSDH
ncbi:AAA family ATPase [Frigoribacterium sp. NBH87]|uniref:AAA family ATPase n=1 Tax=Frigoribacterium sp. NBH87 TaxID=2596916 RepID=UPI001626A49D|nr:AAA family ATPase [Frigoribacterium sp. NBH87]QNE42941.1 AAA family ATPase [Frigoribacterium sp. NBH87]